MPTSTGEPWPPCYRGGNHRIRLYCLHPSANANKRGAKRPQGIFHTIHIASFLILASLHRQRGVLRHLPWPI